MAAPASFLAEQIVSCTIGFSTISTEHRSLFITKIFCQTSCSSYSPKFLLPKFSIVWYMYCVISNLCVYVYVVLLYK